MFVHCVYFWLHEDLRPQEREAFLAGVNSLTTIETVVQGSVGTPAETDRPVIDRTYSYALIVVFRNKIAHDAYQAHPTHDVFRAKCSAYWSRVQIYDVNTLEPGSGAT